MSEYSAYVGLDVHKETIAVAVARPEREEPDYRGVISNRRTLLRWLIGKLGPDGEAVSFAMRRVRAHMARIARSRHRVITATLLRPA